MSGPLIFDFRFRIFRDNFFSILELNFIILYLLEKIWDCLSNNDFDLRLLYSNNYLQGIIKFEVWTLLIIIISLTKWKRLRLSIDIDDCSTKDGLELFII